MLKHGILGLLNYGDMTGYEIMTAFRDSLQFFWSANTSQIYRELQTLKDKGFVQGQKVEQDSKPDKNIFSITDAGRAELKDWLREENYGKRNIGLLMKVFFSGEITRGENIERFRHIQQFCKEYMEGLGRGNQAAENYGNVVDDREKTLYWNMTLKFGKKYVQMVNEWCEECIEELEELGHEDTCD